MNAHFLRGQVLHQQERFKEAAAEYQLAVGEEPDNGFFHAMLANALFRCDRWNDAFASATTALAKDPSDAFAHWVMALLQLERGHFKEAEESIRSAIELEPEDADNHGLLARIHVERSNHDAALQAAEAGLAHDPHNDLCLTFRARALMGLGRETEAREDADALLADDPDDPWNHCLRGDQLLAERDYNGAREHYVEALRLDPRNQMARYGLAVSLKARSPIYSVLLRMLFQVDRVRGWAVWVLVVLLFLGLRTGDALTKAHPDWIVPYEIAKVLFWGSAILLFLANPLFDLLLRFDRKTRHVLTDDEIRATTWYLVCFGFAALCGIWASFGRSGYLLRAIGLTALFFTQAVSQTFQAPPGYVRRRMAVLSIVAACCLVLAPVIFVAGLVWIIGTRQSHLLGPFIRIVFWIPVAVMLFSVFADTIREYFEKRRPDES